MYTDTQKQLQRMVPVAVEAVRLLYETVKNRKIRELLINMENGEKNGQNN